jgi:hypothetical protein
MSNLHVYGQEHPHDDVFIVGSKEALLSLRGAIDRAISDGEASDSAMTGDGEGYVVLVVQVRPEALETAAMPYARDDFGGEGSAPHELLTSGTYKRLVEEAIKKAEAP